jgi:hypothetical protein
MPAATVQSQMMMPLGNDATFRRRMRIHSQPMSSPTANGHIVEENPLHDAAW